MASNPNTPFRSSLPTPGGSLGGRKSLSSNPDSQSSIPSSSGSGSNGPRKSLLRTPSSSTNPESVSNPQTQTPTRFITPKRTSLSASTSNSITPSQPPPVPPLPNSTSTFTSSTISSAAKAKARVNDASSAGARRGRQLEIGEEVMIQGTDLTGVIRHLGAVKFRPGHYAGLELTGDSVGKGKNDGSVEGWVWDWEDWIYPPCMPFKISSSLFVFSFWFHLSFSHLSTTIPSPVNNTLPQPPWMECSALLPRS